MMQSEKYKMQNEGEEEALFKGLSMKWEVGEEDLHHEGLEEHEEGRSK